MELAARCRTCGRKIQPGAKTHGCGFGYVVTSLMKYGKEIGYVRGQLVQTPWRAILQASPVGTTVTSDEKATLGRLRELGRPIYQS